MFNIDKKKLFLFISFLMALSASTVLPDKIVGRNLFYLSITAVVVTFLFCRKSLQIRKEDVLLAIAFFCAGISQLIWTKVFPTPGESPFMADANYPRTSAYLLMSALMVLILPALASTYNLKKSCRLTLSLMLLAGFSYLSARGIAYSITDPGLRLRIDSAATITAYLYALQSFLVIHLLRILDSKGKRAMIALVIAVSVYVILLTQTRSVLILYPILLLHYCIANKIWSYKKIALGSGAIIIFIMLLVSFFFQNVQTRLHQMINETAEYSTNNDTSIGARFTMWSAGIYSLEQHPFGQSTKTRYHEVEQYINTYQHGNSEGLRNAVYHLHNDIIDSASLQGVWGGISLIMLFVALLFFFYKKEVLKSAFPMLVSPVFLFGLGDTLFINDRFIVMFCMQICLFTITAPLCSTKNPDLAG